MRKAQTDREFGRRSVLGLLAAGAAAPVLAACGGKSSAKDAAAVSSAGTSPAASASAAAGGGPDIFMIIRHAEKPTGNGAPYGVTVDGVQDPESLIVDGWTRAGALVELFDPRTSQGAPAPLRPGLTRPVNVVAANPGSDGSKRPEETVTPLAAALGVSIDLKYEEGDEAAMVASLPGLSGPTLVCWEHTEIPTIISHLGKVTPPAPTSWPSSVFDVVFVFTRSGNGWTFTQVPQELLAGDSTTPIT